MCMTVCQTGLVCNVINFINAQNEILTIGCLYDLSEIENVKLVTIPFFDDSNYIYASRNVIRTN